MNINITEHVTRGEGTFLGHCVLISTNEEVINALTSDKEFKKTGIADLVLTMNDKELQIEKFFEELDNQHTEMVKKQAKEMIEDKLRELDDLIFEVRQSVINRLGIDIDEN